MVCFRHNRCLVGCRLVCGLLVEGMIGARQGGRHRAALQRVYLPFRLRQDRKSESAFEIYERAQVDTPLHHVTPPHRVAAAVMMCYFIQQITCNIVVTHHSMLGGGFRLLLPANQQQQQPKTTWSFSHRIMNLVVTRCVVFQ